MSVLRSRWMAPLLMLGLAVFIGWALWLGVSVRELRSRVEQHVGWLRVVDRPAPADEAFHRAMDEMERDAALASRVGRLRRELPEEGVGRTRGALRDLLRERTAVLSATLGARWKQMQILSALAIALAGLVALLFFVARRQLGELDLLSRALALRVSDLEQRDAQLAARLSELQDRDRLLRTVAGSVVHEINNPLCYVSMDLSALAVRGEDARSERLVAMCQRALEGADRITRLSKDLRELTLEPAEEVAIDLGKVIESAVRLSAGRVRSGIRIHREVSRHLPPVRGSQLRIEQVFLNLVINAADACREAQARGITPVGQGNVEITSEVRSDAVIIEVRDNGVGFDEEPESSFQPFVTTKGVGTGLGLYVARRIIEEHGGRLELEGQARGGAVARVTLPC